MKNRKGIACFTCIAVLAFSALACGAPESGKSNGDDPDTAEIRQYRLTMDKVEKAATATQEFYQLVASNPELKAQIDAEDSDKSISDKVKTYEAKFPQAVAILHRNGFATREYVVVCLAMVNDIMIVGMKKQGAIKDYPADSITKENASFVEANYDKLSALAAKMTPPNS
ncbi:MAG TPA: hypothetical protein VKB38_12305 [Terracidiphilus sp.]|nr:hypothetical protein [Terracidiphilus sp.]